MLKLFFSIFNKKKEDSSQGCVNTRGVVGLAFLVHNPNALRLEKSQDVHEAITCSQISNGNRMYKMFRLELSNWIELGSADLDNREIVHADVDRTEASIAVSLDYTRAPDLLTSLLDVDGDILTLANGVEILNNGLHCEC